MAKVHFTNDKVIIADTEQTSHHNLNELNVKLNNIHLKINIQKTKLMITHVCNKNTVSIFPTT